MKAIVTRLLPDKRREKVLVDNWPDPEGPSGKRIYDVLRDTPNKLFGTVFDWQ